MFFKILYPLTIYLIWRLLIHFYQLVFQGFSVDLIVYSWVTKWDGAHYISIAQNGYQYPQQAFFPLWPLFLKAASLISSNYLIVYLLSFILGATVFVLFYKLAEELFNQKIAKMSLIVFCSFPTTIFLIANYTENLYLLLAITSFYFLEKKKYLFSFITAGVSSSTRLVGIFITLSNVFFIKQKNKWLPYFLIGVMGVISYMMYLQIYFNDPLLFTKAQLEWCLSQGRCQLTFPLNTLSEYGKLISIGWIKPTLTPTFIDWFFSVIFLLLLIPAFKLLKINYVIYCTAVILLPLTSGSSVSMIRYLLAAFPLFFIVPFLTRYKLILYILSLLLFLLQLRFVRLFTSGMWVA